MPSRKLADVTIASGQTDSPVIDLHHWNYHHITALLIVAPTTLPETVTVHATAALGGTYQPYQQLTGTDLTLPAAKARKLDPVGHIAALKLIAGGAVAADRDFEISAGEAIPT